VTEFDDALTLSAEPVTGSADRLDARSVRRFGARLGDGWRIGHAVNGGLLLAVLGQAVRATLAEGGHPDPLAVSAHYLSAGVAGPAWVDVEPVRVGRTVATAGASLAQHGPDGSSVERVRAVATYGDLSRHGDDVRTSAQPPELPPVEECVDASSAPPALLGDLPFLDRFDLRLDPATAGWAVGSPSGRGTMQGWLRTADGREPDPLLLLLAVDALPPVTFDLGLTGWTPTLALSAHVRARPAPGWLQVRISTRNPAGGLLEEDAEVWDSAGRLVAQSRQLAAAPRS
jgi:acyl-CoA thioesterase